MFQDQDGPPNQQSHCVDLSTDAEGKFAYCALTQSRLQIQAQSGRSRSLPLEVETSSDRGLAAVSVVLP